MPDREHEKRFWENFGEHSTDEHVARKRIAERNVALALGHPGDEFSSVFLHLAHVLAPKRFPFWGDKAGQLARPAELDGQRSMRKI